MKPLHRAHAILSTSIFTMLAVSYSAYQASAATSSWVPTAPGSFTWSDGSNWTPLAPAGAAGDIINLTANLSSAQTINLDVNTVIGTLNLGDPGATTFGYTLQSSNGSSITMDNGASAAVIAKAAAATASDVVATNIVLGSTGNANLNLSNLNPNITGLLTISGNISETGGAHNLVVSGASAANGVTVLTGNNTFTGTVTIGSGTLRAVGAQSLNSGAANTISLGAATLDLRADGNGTDSGSDTVSGTTINTERITYGDNVTLTASGTINVDRVGGYTAATASQAGQIFQTPANKTIALNNLTVGAATLTVTNANGCGLEFTGATSLTGSTLAVNTASGGATNVPSLTLSGVVGGTTYTKSGAGTLLLTNAGNTNTGNITVTGGVLGATSNGALGTSTNQIIIGSTAASTFQAFDTFTATGRTIQLANSTSTNNSIGVSQGKTLTLDTAFGGSAVNGFQKTDTGTLILGVDNTGRSGATTVAGGILQLTTNDGTGSGAITVSSAIGNALYLSGNITEASALTIFNTGVNSSGALYSLSGDNTVGAITLGAVANIGAASSASLTVTGNVGGAFTATVAGEGTVTFKGTFANNLATGRSTNTVGPTVFLTANNALAAAQTLTLNGGSVTIGDSTGTGSLATAGTGAVAANFGSILTIDNSGTAAANGRVLNGSRTLTLLSSTLNYKGSASAVSTETTTGLLTVGVGQSTINITGGTSGGAATMTFGGLASNVVNVGGFLRLTGLDTNNQVIFTAAPTLDGTGSTGVIRRAAIVNGTAASLVTATAGSAVTAATLTSVTGDLNNTAAAPVPFTATNNAQLTTGDHYVAGPGTTTVNALVMDGGSNSSLGGPAGQIFTVTSGNILVAGSTTAVLGNTASPLNGLVIAQGTVPTTFMVNTGSTLQLASTITSGTNTGLQKALDGAMDVTSKQFFTTGTGIFDITGGTVKLSAGDHTFAAGQVNFAVGPGATLDLNGTVLQAASLSSSGNSAIAGSGGTITNTSLTQATLYTRAGGSWGGVIQGDIFVGSSSARTLSANNTYSGATLIAGGALTLTDLGRLSDTSAIDINGGNLTILNTGTVNLNDRIADDATITFRTGSLLFNGRAQTASSETLGTVILAQGTTNFGINAGGTGTNSADLIITTLTRSSTDAALNFNPIANANLGSATRIVVTNGLTGNSALINNILPWAVAGGNEFLSYNGAYGLSNISNAGMAGYDRDLANSQTFTNLAATENIRNTGTFTSILGDIGGVGAAGNITVNSLTLNAGAASTIGFADDLDTLYLTSGGLLRTGSTATIGSTLDNGRIAAGGIGATGLQTLHFHNTGGGTTLNSRVVDNSATALTRLVFDLYNAGNVTIANGNNSYSGGTVVNGWASNTGGSSSGTVTAAVVNAIPAGGLTINSSAVTASVVGAINAANDVTINMGGLLTLASGTNTLNSLTMNASGFTGTSSAPTINIGNATSVLFLTTPTITASSNNTGTGTSALGTNVITGSTGAQLNFSGQTAVFAVDGIKQNGKIVDPWTPTLQVGVIIANANGLTKNGDGVLRLDSQSTFAGGVNLTAGGIMIGGNSAGTARVILANLAPVVTAGPLGTGTLTVAGGTRLLSSAANTVANAVQVNGNFEFDGINNLTLNGDVDLGGATRTISVNTPQMTATLNGIVSNGSITKDGYGTLVLGNANLLTGTVTLNNGTLVGIAPFFSNLYSASPFGTGAINYNGGTLSMRTASGNASVDGVFNNDINVGAGVKYVNFDVQGGLGNQVSMGTLNIAMSPNPGTTQINVTGTAGSTLKFATETLGSNSTPASIARVNGQYNSFNIATGVTTILMGSYARNNEPLNIGGGTLLLGGANAFATATTITNSQQGVAPKANAITAVYGSSQTVTLTGGTTGAPLLYTFQPQANTVIAGTSTGGLQQTASNVAGGTLNAASTWGVGATSSYDGVHPNDASLDRVLHTNAAISTLGIFNGYLSVTNAGTYSFILGSDDYSSLVIDGVEVARDIASGHAVQDTARGSIFLSAGQHAITYKINTGTGTAGGGGRLLWSGPDTLANGTNNGFQAIDGAKLSYFTGPASAANSYYNAAQVDNDYLLSAGSVFTFQGLGTDYNSTIKSLTMGAASQINVTNDLGTTGVGGTGFIGVKGVTNISAGGATLNPTSGVLYLIGGINDGVAKGLTKSGNGTLMLNNSTAFTGPLAVNLGTVVLREGNALTTGGTTVASGASLDLFGVSSTAGRNITINGNGTASQIGAIYNSQAATGTVAGTVTMATSSQISGFGDVILSGGFTATAGVTLTKVGSNALTISGNNTAFLAPIAVNLGVLVNGTLNNGLATNLGTGTITLAAGTALNLSGNNLARSVTANGTSIANYGPNANSLGNIINSSISLGVGVRNTVTPGSSMLLLPNTAGTATISGNIAMNTATLGIGSNTFSNGGDIIVTSIISGGQALTKVGGNTLFLRGVNTYTGATNINYGTVVLDSTGVLNGGSTTALVTIQTGASLILDNSGTLVQNRLSNNTAANNKALTLNGGTFTVKGNSSATALGESVNASVLAGNTWGITIGSGQNYINLVDDAAAGSGGITVTVTKAGTGYDLNSTNGSTVLITGKNLGLNNAGTADFTNLVMGSGSSVNALAVTGQNSTTAGAGSGVNKGLAPWALVDDGVNGFNFATLDSAARGVRGLGTVTGEYVAANTNTLVANSNTLISSATAVSTLFANNSVSINSLKLIGGSLTIAQGSNLNIQSGGILATADATIDGPGIISADGTPVNNTTAASQNLYLWATGTTTLTVNSSLGYANNNSGRFGELVKAGTGTVVLGGANFFTTNTRVNEGTLKLNNSQALFFRQPTGATPNNGNSSNFGATLQVNAGGTVDLNGFDLTANNLNSINPAGNQGSLSGGTIINNAVGTTQNLTIATTGDNVWSGNISGGLGAINFARYGRNTTAGAAFTITNANTYTGTTIFGGGVNTLVDLGALRNTSGVSINAAALFWNDTGSQADAYRLGATPAPVTFNGGSFIYNARSGDGSVANLGAVTILSGSNEIRATAATLGNANVVMTGFTRSGHATINFAGSVLGDDGNILVNGTAPTNYNGILGGWAITNTSNPYDYQGSTAQPGDFVMYDPATGFRAAVDYKTTGGIGYSTAGAVQPAYGNAAFAANANVHVNSNTTLVAGNNVANSVVLGLTTGGITLSFANANDTLFVQSGGILADASAQTKVLGASVATGGKITAGNINGSAGAGNAGYELFLHNLSTILTVNSQIVDNGGHAVTLVTSSGNVNGPVIRFNNTNTYFGATVINGGDIRLNSAVGPAFANSTNITIQGGVESTPDTGRQTASRIFFEQGNQLNSGAHVTISNGAANLDLNNFNQTLASLTFNNIGGHSASSSGQGPSVRTGFGVLTLTDSITATSLTNTSTIPFIGGNLNLAGGQRTVTVDALTGAGVQGAAMIGLSIYANISNGGIDKQGNGVLAITGVNDYTGNTNVNQGTLVLGGRDQAATPAAITANLQGSRVNVAGGATVDLRGGNAFVGSLNGAGTVTNSVYGTTVNANTGTPSTLTIGLDNTSTGDFSGRFTNFINGINETTGYTLNVTKLGSGTQTISGDNASSLSPTGSAGDINNVGTLDIQEGTILVNGANGSLGFTTINLKAGGSLTIESGKSNRLGGYRVSDSANGDTANDTTTARSIVLLGGTLNFQEGATQINEGGAAVLAMGTNNGAPALTLSSGASTFNFNKTGTNLGATINFASLTAGSGSIFINVGSGQTFGQSIAGADSINFYVNNGMTGQGSGTLSSFGTTVGAAAGVNLNVVGGIRADLTASDGSDIGFVTYDKYGYRLLNSGESFDFPTQPTTPLTTGTATTPTNPLPNWAAINPTINTAYTGNAVVKTALTLTTNTTVQSLRLNSGGGITSAGGAVPSSAAPNGQNFNALGLLNTVTVATGAIIANTGNTGFKGGAVSAAAGILRINTAGNLDSSSYLISTAVGNALVKDGAGVLNQTKKIYLGSSTDQGFTTVNAGTLQLNAGANTLAALNTAGVSFVDNLTVNAGGTVNLMGNDQVIANLTSADGSPGGGGTVTSVGAANLFANSNSNFGGAVTGAINFFKTGTGNLTLSNVSSYTGTTNIQGGILILQDNATLASTTFNLNGGQLRYDNRATSLAGMSNRTSSTATWNMNGGIFLTLARPGENVVVDQIQTVNVQSGYNELRVDAAGGTAAALSVNALNVSSGAQVFFNTNFGTLGNTGANPTIALNNFNAGTMAINGVIPWAVMDTTSDANTATLVMYNTAINPLTGAAYGVSAPNTTAGGVTIPNFQRTDFTTAGTGENVNHTAGTFTEAPIVTARAFNALRFSQNTATALNLAPAELLRLEAGVIVNAQNTLAFNNGRITAGPAVNAPANFYINATNTAVTVTSQIVNNGTGALTLVKGGGSSLTLNPSIAAGLSATGAAANATTAGSTTVNIASAPTTPVAVGDPVIGPGIPNGATVTAILSTTSFTISAPAFASTTGGSIGFGSAQVITGTNPTVASGAVGALAITVNAAQADSLFVGQTIGGVGLPGGVTIASIVGTTVTTTSFTASAAVSADQAFGYSSANVSTNSGYTGATIVNTGTLALNGAVGSRSLGGGSLTINNGGIVTMTNAGQIAPNTDVTIRGGGSLTFTPVTAVSPTVGGINVLNSLTFDNNGGTAQPKVDPGAAGILTIKNGLITSNSDNQGSAPLVGGGTGAILNFGQIALASAAAGNTVSVADVDGFAVGQTVVSSALGIAAGTTILAINGNTLTLSAAVTGGSGAISTLNQAPGGTTALAPTLNITTNYPNKLSADLVISAIIANSGAGGAGIGGWSNLANGGAALTKTGNGNLVLSGANTFDNGFNLNQGTVTVANAAAFGTGTLTIGDGTTILTEGTVKTLTNAVVVNGNFTFGGQQAGHNLTLNGTMNLGAANRTLSVASPLVTATIGGVVSGSGGLTKGGNGILVLSGVNTFSGGITVAGGLLQTNNAAALGITTNDLTVNAAGALNVNGNNLTVDGLFGDDTTSGGLITNASGSTVATLTVGSNNEAGATFAGTLTNAARALNLTKTGTGAQNLTGDSSYTGTTIVNGGQLLVDGTLRGLSATTVNTTGTLGGSGSTNGAVSVVSGGILAPGGSVSTGSYKSSIGTLSTGALSLAGGSNFNVVLGSGGANHAAPGNSGRAAVTGNLTIASGTILNLTDNANAGGLGNFGPGSQKIASYTGTGPTGLFSVVNVGGSAGTITNVTATSENVTSGSLPSTIHGLLISHVAVDKAIYVDAYAFAQAGALPATLDLGNYHVGGTSAPVVIPISNTTPASIYTETLNASFGTVASGLVASGSVSGLAGGSNSSAMTVSLDTSVVGTRTGGSVQVNFASAAVAGSGFTGTTALASQTTIINPTGTVYSGQGVWAKLGNGSWGGTSSAATSGNWTTNGAALDNTNAALPGVDGALSIDDTATIGGNLGAGTINLDGATPAISSLTFNGGTTGIIAPGTGGLLALRNNSSAVNPTITVSGNSAPTVSASVTLTNNTTVNTATANDSLTVSGAIGGSGTGLTKTGAGTLTLAGNNTYTGATQANGGKAIVSGSLSGSTVSVGSAGALQVDGTITSAAAVNVAGLLSGSGTITGASGDLNVANTGTILPGTDGTVGTLTAASLTTAGNLTNKATLTLDLASASSYDRIATTSAINLASGENTKLTINLLGGYKPTDGTIFYIVTDSNPGAAATTGLFANTSVQTLPTFGTVTTIAFGAQTFAVSYSANFEGTSFTGGNDIALMAVPEPGSLAMLISSLALSVGVQRFRRRRS